MSHRNTRRRLAYCLGLSLLLVILWMMYPGDLGEKETSLAMVIVPSIVGGLIAFITGETYSDHSERKNDRSDHGDTK